MSIHIQYYKTRALGELILGSYHEQLCLLDFRYRKMRQTVDKRLQRYLGAEFVEQDNTVLTATRQQLDAYLAGERTAFDLPLLFAGTDFQKAVWNALLEIPYGSTASYLSLAQHLNKEKAVRAVASANGANAIAVIVPCHRIIGSHGELVGYGGGLPIKQRLLQLEGAWAQPSLL